MHVVHSYRSIYLRVNCKSVVMKHSVVVEDLSNLSLSACSLSMLGHSAAHRIEIRFPYEEKQTGLESHLLN